jgi:hypothetical protein
MKRLKFLWRYVFLLNSFISFCKIMILVQFFVHTDNFHMVYSNYNISIQNFERIHAAIGNLCFIQAEGEKYSWLSDSGVIFWSIFSTVNLNVVYSSYNISMRIVKRIYAALGKLCFIQFRRGSMLSFLIQVQFFA